MPYVRLPLSERVPILLASDLNQSAAVLISLGEHFAVLNLNHGSALGTRATPLSSFKPFRRRFVLGLVNCGNAGVGSPSRRPEHRDFPLPVGAINHHLAAACGRWCSKTHVHNRPPLGRNPLIPEVCPPLSANIACSFPASRDFAVSEISDCLMSVSGRRNAASFTPWVQGAQGGHRIVTRRQSQDRHGCIKPWEH